MRKYMRHKYFRLFTANWPETCRVAVVRLPGGQAGDRTADKPTASKSAGGRQCKWGAGDVERVGDRLVPSSGLRRRPLCAKSRFFVVSAVSAELGGGRCCGDQRRCCRWSWCCGSPLQRPPPSGGALSCWTPRDPDQVRRVCWILQAKDKQREIARHGATAENLPSDNISFCFFLVPFFCFFGVPTGQALSSKNLKQNFRHGSQVSPRGEAC